MRDIMHMRNVLTCTLDDIQRGWRTIQWLYFTNNGYFGKYNVMEHIRCDYRTRNRVIIYIKYINR